MDRPKLRNVERIPLQRGREALLVLRDPLAVAEPFAIDAELAGALDQLDGRKSVAQVRQALLMGPNALDISLASLTEFIEALSAGGWLDDDNFRGQWIAIHDAFLGAARRDPILAGVLYPSEPEALRELLSTTLGPTPPTGAQTWGIVIPHGPPEVTGSILRATLPALPDPGSIDVVVVIGTDHHAGLLPIAVCDKDYASPLGVAPCAVDVVGRMCRRMPWIDREAIRHRHAHSLEWSVLYLQHAFGQRCPAIVPIVVGATAVGDAGTAAEVGEVAAFIDTLVADGRAIVCVAAELTHAGAAYGRPLPDAATRAALEARDRDLLEAAVNGQTGRAIRFGRAWAEHGVPSGLPPLALLADAVPEGVEGRISAYTLTSTSVASGSPGWLGLGGAVIHRPE